MATAYTGNRLRSCRLTLPASLPRFPHSISVPRFPTSCKPSVYTRDDLRSSAGTFLSRCSILSHHLIHFSSGSAGHMLMDCKSENVMFLCMHLMIPHTREREREREMQEITARSSRLQLRSSAQKRVPVGRGSAAGATQTRRGEGERRGGGEAGVKREVLQRRELLRSSIHYTSDRRNRGRWL